MSITAQTGVRHGEDLLDAVSWFDEQPRSLSSIETFRNRVEQIGLQLRASNVVELARERGIDVFSVRANLLDPEPRRSIR